MNLRAPSNPIFAASDLAAWPEIGRTLERRARPAQSGAGDRYVKKDLTTKPPLSAAAGEGRWRQQLRETAKLHNRIRNLNFYGVEPEHLAERFGLGLPAINAILKGVG